MQIFRLTGVCWHEGEPVVSKCPELGVASCGDSIEEAMANLREAVELYLENARELGLLEDLPSPGAEVRFTTQFEVAIA
ncbi:MAG: type II toxin-antitoxin system HicB family antitoxin [Bryobacteraceae bacterium]|jgi:predicted RNase H-like HicB family nuclease